MLQRSTPTKGGSTSPTGSSPLNGISNNYGMNGTLTNSKNGCYGTSYDNNNYGSSNDDGNNADFIGSLLKLKDVSISFASLS